MEEKKQQFNQVWDLNHDYNMSPKANRDNICLSIIQDLAQAVVIFESNYDDFLDEDG